MRKSFSPEIIVPVGTKEHIKIAFEEGAGSIYLGLRGYSSRPDRFGFEISNIVKYIKIAKDQKMRIYIAVNAELKEPSGREAIKVLKKLDTLDANGLIIGDLGMLYLAKTAKIKTPLHASSLLGIYNNYSLKAIREFGVSRIILPTNLLISEIADLVHSFPEMEYEIIVYQGVCFQDSWRCGLSHEINNDHNFEVQCKKKFTRIRGHQIIEQEKTIGDWLWAPDIDLSESIELLMRIGISHFKIEGRTQSKENIRKATRIIRNAVDNVNSLSQSPFNINKYHYFIHPSYIK